MRSPRFVAALLVVVLAAHTVTCQQRSAKEASKRKKVMGSGRGSNVGPTQATRNRNVIVAVLGPPMVITRRPQRQVPATNNGTRTSSPALSPAINKTEGAPTQQQQNTTTAQLTSPNSTTSDARQPVRYDVVKPADVVGIDGSRPWPTPSLGQYVPKVDQTNATQAQDGRQRDSPAGPRNGIQSSTLQAGNNASSVLQLSNVSDPTGLGSEARRAFFQDKAQFSRRQASIAWEDEKRRIRQQKEQRYAPGAANDDETSPEERFQKAYLLAKMNEERAKSQARARAEAAAAQQAVQKTFVGGVTAAAQNVSRSDNKTKQ
jgi:hypothetical protein